MTAEKAKEIIEIVAAHNFQLIKELYELENIKVALLETVKDGISEYRLFELMLFAGLNLDSEEIFDALFHESFKCFLANQKKESELSE